MDRLTNTHTDVHGHCVSRWQSSFCAWAGDTPSIVQKIYLLMHSEEILLRVAVYLRILIETMQNGRASSHFRFQL
jgi:hypothetical protein